MRSDPQRADSVCTKSSCGEILSLFKMSSEHPHASIHPSILYQGLFCIRGLDPSQLEGEASFFLIRWKVMYSDRTPQE